MIYYLVKLDIYHSNLMRSPYGKDVDSDIVLRDNPYSYYAYVYSKVNYTFNPQN
jgi:hypothetical protein